MMWAVERHKFKKLILGYCMPVSKNSIRQKITSLGEWEL